MINKPESLITALSPFFSSQYDENERRKLIFNAVTMSAVSFETENRFIQSLESVIHEYATQLASCFIADIDGGYYPCPEDSSSAREEFLNYCANLRTPSISVDGAEKRKELK